MTEIPQEARRPRPPEAGAHARTKPYQDGLYLVALGALVFVLLGLVLEAAAPVSTVDFRVVYYSARCLLEHRDPYNENELDRVYRTENGESPHDSPQIRRSERHYNYLPTAFIVTVPFALLPFGPAHLMWLLLTAGCIVVASWLMWSVAATSEPTLAGALVCLSLLTSELFLILGNPAGFAVSLCVIGVWCFLKRRLVVVGIVCFALSLMLKPHDSGLIWLYFLLAGGTYRRHALHTLFAVCALSLPVVLWVTCLAPNWMQELHNILVTYSSRGDVNDPGPTSMASHGIGMVISLQAAVSVFHDDPGFYNPVTYLLCGPMLAFWMLKTLRIRPTEELAWIALAPIAALSMLPIYHRIYDAKLLLVAIPACALLWREGSRQSRVTVGVTALGIAITGGMPWAIFLFLLHRGRLPAWLSSYTVATILQVFPVPVVLLILTILALGAYHRFANNNRTAALSGDLT
jgi:hypothetical protein